MYPERSQLAEACIAQLSYALGVSRSPRAQRLVRLLFGRAVSRFLDLVVATDLEIGANGTAAASRMLLHRFVAGHEATGVERIPSEGPLLVVANHPGAYDAPVIGAYLERPDIKFIVRDVSLFRHLPHLREHAIFTPKGKNALRRIRPARECIRHLGDGGALLVFPRGRLEPDPAWMPGADAEFDLWSPVLRMLTDRVPETRVMVAIVGGVIAPSALRHPVTRLRKTPRSRQRLAWMYQLVRQALSGSELFGLRPRVTFGEVLIAREHADIRAAVEASARRTLARHVGMSPALAHARRDATAPLSIPSDGTAG